MRGIHPAIDKKRSVIGQTQILDQNHQKIVADITDLDDTVYAHAHLMQQVMKAQTIYYLIARVSYLQYHEATFPTMSIPFLLFRYCPPPLSIAKLPSNPNTQSQV